MKIIDADFLIEKLSEISDAGYPMVSVSGVIEMIEAMAEDSDEDIEN